MISARQHPISAKHKPLVEGEINRMLKLGVIEPCQDCAGWSTPIVVVSKKDGSPRVCFDARELNKVTKKDAYPVSQAKDCLRRMKGAVLFSSGDALSGFWQIAVRKEDEEKQTKKVKKGIRS